MKTFNGFRFVSLVLVVLLVSSFMLTGCMEEEESIDESLVSIGDDIDEREDEDEFEEVVEEEEKPEELDDEKDDVDETIDLDKEVEEEPEREPAEFGDEDTLLEGATSADGARVVSYSYSIQGGVFEFVWGVRGSDAEPTPEVQAKYNADDDIIVVFPDLESDYIAVDSDDFEVPGVSDSVSWNRSGSESMYKFEFDEKQEYSLEPSADEEEVVLTVRL